MRGICIFCNEDKDLTRHHIIAQSYNGTDDAQNLIPNTCEDCHKKLEGEMEKVRGWVGAGRIPSGDYNFTIGQTGACITAGSVLLDDACVGILNTGSPIFGMRCHNKEVGERYIEVAFSGSSAVLITGSPPNSWVVYSLATPVNQPIKLESL